MLSSGYDADYIETTFFKLTFATNHFFPNMIIQHLWAFLKRILNDFARITP